MVFRGHLLSDDLWITSLQKQGSQQNAPIDQKQEDTARRPEDRRWRDACSVCLGKQFHKRRIEGRPQGALGMGAAAGTSTLPRERIAGRYEHGQEV